MNPADQSGVPLKDHLEEVFKIQFDSMDRRVSAFESKPLIDRPTFDVIHNVLERRVAAVEGRVWVMFGGVFVANIVIAALLAWFKR